LFVVLARDSSSGRNSFDKTHFLKEMAMALPDQDQVVQKPVLSDTLHTNIDVQQQCNVGATTVHKWVKQGLLTPIRFSKRLVRYRASEVEALIQSAIKKGGA
jgi:predicted DNA-binding transcriptional regulator AlpA